MSLQKITTRKKTNNAGDLGSVPRSLGYLHGGYRDTTIWSKLQYFNTLTGVGVIVGDTGYQRSYSPGISGNFSGFYSINTNSDFAKLNYNTLTSKYSFSRAKAPTTTISDTNAYSQAWLMMATGAWNNAIDEYIQLNLSTDTTVSYGNLYGGILGTSRQGLSTGIGGFISNYTYSNIFSLNYINKSVAYAGSDGNLDSGTGPAAGMNNSNTYGFFVGFAPRNVKFKFSGTTIISSNNTTSYSYNFSESHSISSPDYGYMMAGHPDTTGRYGGIQHGLCQRISFVTEAISTMNDLALPQSSGQMMQGY